MGARIDFAAPDGVGPRLRQAFAAPCMRLVAPTAGEVRAVLDALQAQAEAGGWCVGAVRHEAAAEGVVRVDDLARVQALAVFNSLRGWIPACL